MKNILVFFLILLSCTACYWHLRNPNEVPSQLKLLYLRDEGVESHFNLQLINLLNSMRITLAPTPIQAPYTLHVYNYRLNHDSPSLASTNVAITYTYTMTVIVSITDPSGKIVVPPHLITTSRQVTVNTNQIFTINSTTLFQEELQRETINLIYYWMTSDLTRRFLTTKPVPVRPIDAITAATT